MTCKSIPNARKFFAKTRPSAFVLCIFAAAAQSGLAQVPGLLETMAPQRGIVPFGTYALDKIETINTTSGALGLTIPLAKLAPGRAGFSFGLDLVYNSELYDVAYIADPDFDAGYMTELNDSPTAGWQYSYTYNLELPSILGAGGNGSFMCPGSTDNFYHKLVVIAPDRSSHTMLQIPLSGTSVGNDGNDNLNGDGYFALDTAGVAAGPCATPSYPATLTQTYYSNDGTYLRLVVNSSPTYGSIWTAIHWTLYFPDGREVTGVGADATRIQDANGNGVNITQILDDCLQDFNCLYGTTSVQTVLEDDLLRQITVQHQMSSGGAFAQDSVTAPGYNGTTLTSTVKFTLVNQSGNFNNGTITTPPDPLGYTTPGGVLGYGVGISEIDLPTVGGYTPVYTFGYAGATYAAQGWGELNSMTLPSGATVSYNYALDGGAFRSGQLSANPIIKKTVAQTSPYTVSDVWNYCYQQTSFPVVSCAFSAPSPWACSTDCTVVQDPAQGYTRYDYFDPFGLINRGIVYRSTDQDGSTDETQWWNNRPWLAGADDMANPYPHARVKSVATSGSPSSAAISIFTLDKNGNTLVSDEYDWSSYSSSIITSSTPASFAGTLDREKKSVFVAMTTQQADQGVYGVTSVSNDTSAYWNPSGPLHYNLVHNSTTCGASCGNSSTGVAYAYDGNTYTSLTFSAGNPTAEWHWDSTAGSLSGFLTTPTAGTNATLITRTFDTLSNGNLISVTDPNCDKTTYGYDSSNLYLTSVAQGSNSCGVLTVVTRTFSPLAHDFNTGLLTSLEDNNNGVTNTYSYDVVGRLTVANEAGLRETEYAYHDSTLSLATTSDEASFGDQLLSNTTTFDPLGRVYQTQQTGPSSSTITTQHKFLYSGTSRYELASNPYYTTSDPTMGWTMTQYDQLNRPVCVQTFAGSSAPSPTSSCPATGTTGDSQYSYSGYTTTLTDPASVQRINSVDGLGRLTSVEESSLMSPPTTSYTYDALDHLTGVSQGSTSRSFAYDSLGRLSSATNPESGLTCYGTVTSSVCYPSGGYDGNGNLLKRTDANGNVTTTVYDSLNRPRSKSYSVSYPTVATPTVSYEYDTDHTITGDSATNYKYGRLTQVSNSVSATVYRYDALGRVQSSKQTTSSTAYPFLYTYAPVGLTAETYPSGRSVGLAYDGAGRINQVSGAFSGGINSVYESGVQYTPQGALQQATFGNGNLESTGYVGQGLVETWSFNDRMQPTSIAAAFGSTTLLNLSYYYCGGSIVASCSSNNGNPGLQFIQRPGMSIVQSYIYDGANRVLGAGECVWSGSVCIGSAPWSQLFGYDANGNRVVVPGSYTFGANTTSPVWTPTVITQFNAKNQFVRGTGDVYDNAGNETSVASSSSSPNTVANTMSYDAENRMVTANIGMTSNVYYSYDGDGRRITDSATGTTYVYDAMGQLAAEYSTTAPTDFGTLYLTGDSLGSTRLVTNSFGSELRCYDYMPFGEDIPNGSGPRGSCYTLGTYPSTPDVESAKFTGKERDAESGLDYFGARYLASAQGRFTSVDPVTGTALHIINPQRWNMYAYAMNNPLAFVDPDGQDAIAVNLSKQVFLAGHMGIVSVHQDGAATYGREGPATEGRPIGTNQVKVLPLPNVEFGADGLPTAASYRSLASAIGNIEGQNPSTINLAYFKTSGADTLALDNFLRAKKQASDRGSLFPYFGLGNNCADFCINGLSTARALSSEQAANASTIPNILFWELSFLANSVSTGATRNSPEPKEQVTEQICYEGTNGCALQ